MQTIRLSSGRDVVIRPIRPDDGPRLQAAHERLSAETLYRRFLGPKPRLTSADTRYLVEVDGFDHVAMVATPAGDPERIIGVGRFIRLPEDPEAAEFAIVVGDEFQSEGLGTALVERLSDAARQRGIERFTAMILADNVAVHRFFARLSAGLSSRRFGTIEEVELKLAS
jgi:protein lysine acetyltransferase